MSKIKIKVSTDKIMSWKDNRVMVAEGDLVSSYNLNYYTIIEEGE